MFSRVVYFANMFGMRSSGGSYEKLNEQFDLDTPFFQVCLKGVCKVKGMVGVSVFIYIFSCINDILDVGKGNVEAIFTIASFPLCYNQMH